jgi:hypothetical protein
VAARVLACHPGQGWSLLCNGVVLFDDAGVLVPDASVPDASVPDVLVPDVLVPDPPVATPGRVPVLPRAA